MIINVTPSDIIKRCLWTEYKDFCLSDFNEDEIKKIIEEDESIILSEEDSYFIGLLKIIETDNLVHRFNQNIEDYLKIKSIIYGGRLYIYKSAILREIKSFKDRFPEYYKPSFEYRKGIDDLLVHIEKIYNYVCELEEHEITISDKNVICYQSNLVKKCLDSD